MDLGACELIVLTSGEYSDYRIEGHFKILQDFNLGAERVRFIQTLTEDEKTYYYALPDRFVAWLAKEGRIVDVDVVKEIHLDSHDFMGDL